MTKNQVKRLANKAAQEAVNAGMTKKQAEKFVQAALSAHILASVAKKLKLECELVS